MPIDRHIEQDGTFVRLVGSGVVTEAEYRACIESLYDPGGEDRRPRRTLVDFAAVQTLEMTHESLREITRRQRRFARAFRRPTTVAIVARGAIPYSFAREWEGLVEEEGWRTRVFREAGEAESWLEAEGGRPWRRLPALHPQLEPPALERQFREHCRHRDSRIARALMILSAVFQVVSLPLDHGALQGTGALLPVWAIRMVSAVIAVAGACLVRRTARIELLENLTFLWALTVALGVVVADAILPPTYLAHVAWDLLLTLAVYVVLPLTLRRQVVVASLISIGGIILFWQHKILVWPVTLPDVTAAFVCANLLGIMSSREFHLRRRREFLTRLREADTRRHLESALHEIRTLKGIIPICSHCKRVRTDRGDWTQVEAYVQEHSDAEFSHGICPFCLTEHYPEMTRR